MSRVYTFISLLAIIVIVVTAFTIMKTYNCEELREKCALTQLICNDNECIYLVGDCTKEERVALRACKQAEE